MFKFKKYIKKGINQPLEKVPFHGKAPLTRLLMADKSIIPQVGVHIAVHLIKNLPKKIPSYGELHKHTDDEINLIISGNSKLVYKIVFEDEVYKVTSPATIFIPKGVRHSAEVILGEGIFVCIIFNNRYKAFK